MAKRAEGSLSRCVRAFRTMGLPFNCVLLLAASAHAGVLDVSLVAPATNSDGSALTSLAGYRVYYSTSPSPCPGATFVEIPIPTLSRRNQTIHYQLSGLSTGSTYSVAVTAVYTGGKESACSAVSSAVARGQSVVAPTGTVSFGNVTMGSSATRTFTVKNIGSGTLTGAASVSAPFRIDSGSPFTLVGAGATATVTVRFTPTSTATANTTVSFTANGEMQSRLVAGTGVTASDTMPTLPRETSPPPRASSADERPTPVSAPVSSPGNSLDSERGGQRLEELPQSPGTPPTARSSNDPQDPRAVIDWLLTRRR